MKNTLRRGFARDQLVEEVEVMLGNASHLVTATVSLWCEPDDEQVELTVEGVRIDTVIDPDGEETTLDPSQVGAVREAVTAHALASEWVADQANEDALEQGYRFKGASQLY